MIHTRYDEFGAYNPSDILYLLNEEEIKLLDPIVRSGDLSKVIRFIEDNCSDIAVEQASRLDMSDWIMLLKWWRKQGSKPQPEKRPEKAEQKKVSRGKVGPKHSDNKEQPWVDNDLNYMSTTEAVEFAEFANRKLSLSRLSRILTPDGPVLYMRKKRPKRCKIHLGEFRQYLKTLPTIKLTGNEISDKVLDEYLADAAATQAKIKPEKEKNPQQRRRK